MTKFVGEVAAAVVAAVLTYAAFTLTEESDPALRWSLVCLIGLVGVGAAWLAARTGLSMRQRIAVADQVKAKGDVGVKNVDVSVPSAGETRIGTRISSEGNVRIEDVRAGDSADKKDPSKDPDA